MRAGTVARSGVAGVGGAVGSRGVAGSDRAAGSGGVAGSGAATAGALAKGVSRATATGTAQLPQAAALAASNNQPGPTETDAPSSAIHEEIPEVLPRARRSIHGHVRVSVRVIVDKEGAVFAALVDDPGPSRYFEQVALEAAKKWTFPPADAQGPGAQDRRLELLRFDFTREGATGRAEPIK